MAGLSVLKLQDAGRPEQAEASETQPETADPLLPVWKFCSGERLRDRGWIVAAGSVLLVAALAASTGAIHARLYGHDIFFLLDNGWRALNGQRVHSDYSSAWGPLTFLLVAAGLAVSGASVAAISYANGFVALAAGLWSAWLAAGRSRALTGVVYPCFVALLAAAPFVLGEAPVWTSHGMVYNRYGYALLAIILLECFQPAEDTRSAGRRASEPVLTGCALALLLFLKITYFLVALPLLGTSLLLWSRRRQRALGYAAGFGVSALLFLAYLRFDVAAMVNDLLAAGAARSASLGLRHEFASLLGGVVGHALPLGMLAAGCARLSGAPKPRVVLDWQAGRYALTALAVVAADSLLLVTNAQATSYPLTAAFALVLLVSIEPALLSSAPPRRRRAASLLVLLAGLLAGPMIVEQSVGLIYALYQARANPNPAGVVRFESARLRPLVLADTAQDDVDRYANGREYVASLNDGIRLLAAHTGPADKVATLDMFNPFAYALDRQPIRGGIASAAYQYTLDDRHHPSPARFFADAAVVMVPKYPASAPMFFDGYKKIYEPAIEQEFRLEAESSRWRLYRRVPENASTSPAAHGGGAD